MIPSLAARTGGPAVAIVELARITSEAGMETSIFATEAAYPAATSKGRAVEQEELVAAPADVVVRLFPLRRPYQLARSPELYRALRREVPRFNVIHTHSLYLSPQRVAGREARRRHVPYVVSPHGALDPWLRGRRRGRKALADVLWQRRMLGRAAAIHFATEDEARLAGNVAPGVPKAVVPLGVDVAEFEELPPPTDYGGEPVILFLGRIAVKKGIDVLIRSFAIATRRFDDARLVIAGPDDEGLRPELEALADREGVGDRVIFPGMLRGPDRLAALAAADVWALSSHTENFGIAVLEALAAGIPTVISPAVNLAGAIERAGAGLVSDLQPERFAGALSHLLEDDERRARYAERGREFVSGYDWKTVGPRIVEMYEEVARWARR